MVKFTFSENRSTTLINTRNIFISFLWKGLCYVNIPTIKKKRNLTNTIYVDKINVSDTYFKEITWRIHETFTERVKYSENQLVAPISWHLYKYFIRSIAFIQHVHHKRPVLVGDCYNPHITPRMFIPVLSVFCV